MGGQGSIALQGWLSKTSLIYYCLTTLASSQHLDYPYRTARRFTPLLHLSGLCYTHLTTPKMRSLFSTSFSTLVLLLVSMHPDEAVVIVVSGRFLYRTT